MSETYSTTTLIKSASGGALYSFADGVTPDDIYSTISAKLSQLEAMLTIARSTDTFQSFDGITQENHIWACADLAEECRRLFDAKECHRLFCV